MTATTEKGILPILDYGRDFPFLDYICAFHGAYLYDVTQDCCLVDYSLSSSVIEKIIKKFSMYSLSFFTDRRKISIDDVKSNTAKIYQAELHCSSKKQLHSVIQTLKRSKMKIHFYQRIVEEDFCLEIVSSMAAILSNVESICKKNNFSFDDVCAFGKNITDVEILSNVGCGIFMEGGSSSTLKLAKIQTVSNSNKGFEVGLKKIFS